MQKSADRLNSVIKPEWGLQRWFFKDVWTCEPGCWAWKSDRVMAIYFPVFCLTTSFSALPEKTFFKSDSRQTSASTICFWVKNMLNAFRWRRYLLFSLFLMLPSNGTWATCSYQMGSCAQHMLSAEAAFKLWEHHDEATTVIDLQFNHGCSRVAQPSLQFWQVVSCNENYPAAQKKFSPRTVVTPRVGHWPHWLNCF